MTDGPRSAQTTAAGPPDPRAVLALLDGLRAALVALLPEPAPELARQYVTLDQAAALVRRSKRTLEKYWYDPAKRRRHNPPDPAIEGGGGNAHEWDWEVMRPWLERVFRRVLPERLPDHFRRC